MSFIVAAFLIVKYAKDNYILKRRVAELQQAQIKTEIRLLRNQLNPHVIFNNLNSMYYLSLNNSEWVIPTASRLKSLLTYFFVTGRNHSVPLQAEIKSIEDYIFLEKLRFGQRLDIQFVTNGEGEEWEIVPFTLFTIVENCFNHGANINSTPSWIRIMLDISPGLIVFSSSVSRPENNGLTSFHKTEESGFREKMDFLYPEKYRINIDENRDMFRILFQLKK